MSDEKIPILIFALCIGGALLAGISSPHDPPHSIDASTPASKCSDLWDMIVRAWPGLTKILASREQQAAAPGKQPIASEVPATTGRQPNNNDETSFSETSATRYRLQTAEEARVERIIETAFRQYTRNYRISGESLNIRMPFGLNYEREGGPGYYQIFYLGGKGTPHQLWPYIDSVLASAAFSDYVEGITSPGDKVILFELERKAYSISRDPELFESLRKGIYPGTATRIFIYKRGSMLSEADLYNYLYAVASVGVDCSGFTFHIHDTIAGAHGTDLTTMLGERWKTRPGNVGARVGLWFYDPASGYTEKIEDRIENLRPADVILFRGRDGGLKHSAVVQSIDLKNGLVRYMQCTDWAIESERGVHQSVILFDPSRPEVSLRHYSVIWKQQVQPPFDGETEPRDWLTDRDRYAWYPAAGGSLVVRLRYLAEVLENQDPLYYSNAGGEPNR
jgi:hypothetical protein